MSNVVTVVEEAEIARHLRCPEIMAVIWTGAWSDLSMTFVRDLVAKPEYLKPRTTGISAHFLPELQNPVSKPALEFCEQTARFTTMFQRLGFQLKLNGGYNVASRLEPPRPADSFDADWHVDGSVLTMLSVPVGPTTEYLETSKYVRYDHKRLDVIVGERAEKLAVPMPNNAVVIFKSERFPGLDNKTRFGFIHRRPNAKLLQEARPARFVLHAHAT